MAGVLIPGTRDAVAVTATATCAVYDIESGTASAPRHAAGRLRHSTVAYGPAVSGNGARVAYAERMLRRRPAPRSAIRLSVADVATGDLTPAD